MSQTNKNKSNQDTKIYIYFSDFLKAVKKFWWVCVAFAVLLGGYSFYDGYTNYTPKYQAYATFTVSTQNSSSVNGISAYSFYYDASAANQLAKTFPYLLQTNILKDAIKEDLDVEVLPASLSAQSVAGSNIFTLSSTGLDPQLTYDVLVSTIDNYPAVAKYVVGNIKLDVITAPAVPNAPYNGTEYVMDTIKGILMGITIGGVWMLFYTVQRRTIRTKKDIKAQLNCEHLGDIPRVSFKKYQKQMDQSVLYTNSSVGNSFQESLRVLRNVIMHKLGEGEKVIMSTSTAPSEGKTTVTTNMALALGAYGKKVLLVDADVRHPSVVKLLGLKLDDFDYDAIKEGYKLKKLDDLKITLMVMDPSKDNLQSTTNSKELKQLFKSLREEYDYILIDTPPCGLVSDALFIAPAVDAIVYVISQDTVKVSRIRSGLDNLMSTGTKIIGCVLNNAQTGVGSYGYGKYGYGGYGYGKYGYGKYGYGEKQSRSSKGIHRKK